MIATAVQYERMHDTHIVMPQGHVGVRLREDSLVSKLFQLAEARS